MENERLRVTPPESVSADRAAPESPSGDEIVIAVFHDQARLSAARTALADTGIPFRVHESVPGRDDPIQATAYVILIPPGRFDDAADVVEVVEEAVKPPRSGCPRCGSDQITLGRQPPDALGLTDLAASLVWGLVNFAEGIVGKRFTCRACGHRWP